LRLTFPGTPDAYDFPAIQGDNRLLHLMA